MHEEKDLGASEDPSTQDLGTVLLVEDNLRVSDELSLVLTAAGYATRCAYDGEHMRHVGHDDARCGHVRPELAQ